MVGAEVELLALQAVLAVIALDAAALGIVAHQAGVRAQPDAAAGVRHHPVHGVARQAFLAREHLEADRIRCRRGALHQGEPAAVGPHPHPVARIHRQRVDRVCGQRPRVARVVAEHFDDRAVGARQVEPAAVGPHPQVAVRVLRDRRDVRGAERARRAGAVRQLADASARGVEHVRAAAVSADPDRTVARLENGHDAGGAQGLRIACLYAYGLQPPVGRELAQAIAEGSDPQRAVVILAQRHHPRIADGIVPPGDGVDVGGLAAVIVVQGEAASEGRDPHLVIGRLGECRHQLVSQPGRAVPAELPAAGIPAADAAGARSDPHQAGLVLVQRHDEGVAQRVGIARLVAVVAELSGGAVEHIQPARGSDPQVTRLILEQRPHVVVGERSRVCRIVTQQLQYAAGAVHPLETSIAADPQGARLVLQHPRDAAAAQGAQMKEPVVLGLPAIEPRFGADPQGPRAVEGQGADAVIDQRARVRGIVAQVLDAPRCRLQNVEPRVGGSDPDTIAAIDHDSVHGVAGERGGIVRVVAVDDEGVGGALPARHAAVLDGDPQIVVPVLDDGLDVVARQPAAGAARVGVAEQLMAVEPYEALRVLQGREHRPLRQAVGGRQVIEHQRRVRGVRAGTHPQQAQRCDDQRRRPGAAMGVRAHAPTMHEAVPRCVDRLQARRCQSRFTTRCDTHCQGL